MNRLLYVSVSLCKTKTYVDTATGDSPEGQKLMAAIPPAIREDKPLLMDKAYEGDECRQKVREYGMKPVVPPKSNRNKPWRYSKRL